MLRVFRIMHCKSSVCLKKHIRAGGSNISPKHNPVANMQKSIIILKVTPPNIFLFQCQKLTNTRKDQKTFRVLSFMEVSSNGEFEFTSVTLHASAHKQSRAQNHSQSKKHSSTVHLYTHYGFNPYYLIKMRPRTHGRSKNVLLCETVATKLSIVAVVWGSQGVFQVLDDL